MLLSKAEIASVFCIASRCAELGVCSVRPHPFPTIAPSRRAIVCFRSADLARTLLPGLSWGENSTKDELPNPLVTVCMDLPEGAGEDVTSSTPLGRSRERGDAILFGDI